VAAAVAPATAARAEPAPAASARAVPPPAADFITSPFVGTFYSAPRPDADPFVTAGDRVSAGQTICIIEAMKLFNEIEAEFACIIEETLVESAQPVEYGAKLFRVRRL
jgi:acetyl-CoA carboxylase biotin carboxyl carrier protein